MAEADPHGRKPRRKGLIAVAAIAVVSAYVVFSSGAIGGKGEVPMNTAAPPAGATGGQAVPAGQGATQATPPAATPQSTGEPQSGALVFVNPAEIAGDGAFEVRGEGYRKGEQVVVTMSSAGKSSEVGRVSADKDGAFHGVVVSVTTSLPPGPHEVTARGAESGRSGTATVTLMGGGPWAEPETYAIKQGAELHFKGGGFKPSEKVSVFLDSLAAQPVGTLIADDVGNLNKEAVRVPMATDGDHAFILLGSQSGKPISMVITLLGFHPWVLLSDYTIPPERSIGFSGTDFVPGEEIHVYLGKVGGSPSTMVTASATGAFSVTNALNIPPTVVGQNDVYFVGSMSQRTITATLEILPFTPMLELTVYAGTPGTSVAFKGSGFAKGETIHVYLGSPESGEEVSTFRADNTGAFERIGAFVIPDTQRPGPVDVSVVGEVSKVTTKVEFKVLGLNTWMAIDPYSGPPGTEVTFDGHGFAPGESVSIYVGDDKTPVAQATADKDGNFSKAGPFTVPEGANGHLAIKLVGDTSGVEAYSGFTVQEMPPTPSPMPSAQPERTPSAQPTTGGGQ